ncbi:unnamed protein product [Leptidea sinapis]|uniref:FLYWCH-type domain-containing protein n=1 Tax=Leptidea sinapis TaxID=189913 RepID=A0A5E4Q0A3_9NEOP|nr:unnamed protein product [Leptidea sinapis]
MYNHRNAKFTLSRFGRPVIQIGDMRFNLHFKAKHGSARRWLCNKRRTTGCRACVITIDDVIVKVKNQHNHQYIDLTPVKAENDD